MPDLATDVRELINEWSYPSRLRRYQVAIFSGLNTKRSGA
jgi:hypothetical protein